MNAKHSFLNLALLLLVAALTLALLTGCPGGDNGTDPDPGVSTERTLIVEDGRYPVWVDDSSFLFNYSTQNGTDGIYWSDLDGNVTELYTGPHNHDYVASPNGQWAAFSVPELDGGVYAVELTSPPGDPILLLEGGLHPCFLDDNLVIAEDQTGIFGQLDISNPGTFTEYAAGSHPRVSGDGQYIAYLYSDGSGFELRYLDRSSGNSFALTTLTGADHVWDPTEPMIYASRLTDQTLTNIVAIDVLNGGTVSQIVSGGTRPSISRDGNHLFADKVTAGENDGVYYRNLTSERVESINGAQRPAAAMSGTQLLAEQALGIYLITFD